MIFQTKTVLGNLEGQADGVDVVGACEGLELGKYVGSTAEDNIEH